MRCGARLMSLSAYISATHFSMYFSLGCSILSVRRLTITPMDTTARISCLSLFSIDYASFTLSVK